MATVLVHGAGGDISPFDVVANPQLFQRRLNGCRLNIRNSALTSFVNKSTFYIRNYLI